MVKVMGYVLSENDRAAVRRVVAKVGDTPLFGTALKSRHRPEADADYSYSGYFKIVDASTTGNGTTTHKIRVVDGAGRGASICYINGQVFEVQDWESEAVASPMYVYLRFTLPKYDAEGMNTTPAAAEITMTENPQSADENYAWHQIGRLIFENNMMRIQQDFILGIMNLTVFGVECDG